MAKILIADDDLNTRLWIDRILTKQGHQVIQAEDGRSACAKVLSEKPDLILLDVTMPVADGFQVLEALKEYSATADIPVIMITARAKQEDIMQGMKWATDYLTKPVTPDELRTSVWNVLNSPNHPRVARRFLA